MLPVKISCLAAIAKSASSALGNQNIGSERGDRSIQGLEIDNNVLADCFIRSKILAAGFVKETDLTYPRLTFAALGTAG
jgi:hypothetical protein